MLLQDPHVLAGQDHRSIETTTHRVLVDQAARTPDAIALVDADGPAEAGRVWTYAELRDGAARLAVALLSRFEPGERIAVWAPNSAEWVVLQFAAGSPEGAVWHHRDLTQGARRVVGGAAMRPGDSTLHVMPMFDLAGGGSLTLGAARLPHGGGERLRSRSRPRSHRPPAHRLSVGHTGHVDGDDPGPDSKRARSVVAARGGVRWLRGAAATHPPRAGRPRVRCAGRRSANRVALADRVTPRGF